MTVFSSGVMEYVLLSIVIAITTTIRAAATSTGSFLRFEKKLRLRMILPPCLSLRVQTALHEDLLSCRLAW
jgi:hypothetical protein